MSLEDDIGSFSTRREREAFKPKEVAVEYDDDAYDDWEDEEEEDEPYADIDFRMYKLDELDKFNAEVDALDELIRPWWKNLPTIFTKATFGKIGILEYKRKYLFADEKFEGLYIEDVPKILDAVEIFSQGVRKSYWRRFVRDIVKLTLYVGIASWYGWNMIWHFLLGFTLMGMLIAYFKYRKKKLWRVKAVNFLSSIDESGRELIREEEKNSRIKDVLAFNSYVNQEEKEHWSVKLYDAVANIFKGKK